MKDFRLHGAPDPLTDEQYDEQRKGKQWPGTVFLVVKTNNTNQWKSIFNKYKSNRIEWGITGHSLHRAAETKCPYALLLVLRTSNLEKCKSYLASEDFKKFLLESGTLNSPEKYFSVDIDKTLTTVPKDKGGILWVRLFAKPIFSFSAISEGFFYDWRDISKKNGFEFNKWESDFIFQDLYNQRFIYLTLRVSDMRKAKNYLKTPNFNILLKKAWGVLDEPYIWLGTNLEQSDYENHAEVPTISNFNLHHSTHLSK